MPDGKRAPGTGTQAVHGGEAPPFWGNSLLPPVAQTTTFVFNSVDELIRYKRGELPHPEYGRYGNPTAQVLEAKIAALEGAEDALVSASGLSALSSVLLSLLRPGDHVIALADQYPGTRALFDALLARFGVETTLVPVNDWAALDRARRTRTQALFGEFPSNPHLYAVDLERLAAWARGHGVVTVIDATLASPCLCRPLAFGADLVLHSATKYLGGHNDVLAGVVAGARPMIAAIRELHGLLGAALAPQDAFLLNRGVKTLPLRMARHSANGRLVADRLGADRRVTALYYPGGGAAGCAAEARRYLPGGAGGLVSFRPRGGVPAAHAFVDGLRLIRHAGSLGGVESLVQVPFLFAMLGFSDEEAQARGIEPDLVRLSLGVEDADDLWANIDQALARAHA